MHIFLDESGDLGFDFNLKKTSNFFTITLLVCDTQEAVNAIGKSIERAFKNKIYQKNKKRDITELKGTGTNQNVKEYFLKQALRNDSWKIYSIILDKKAEFRKIPQPIDTHRIYNIMANHLLKQVNYSEAKKVDLFVDKSKNRAGIIEFDSMLRVSLSTILPLKIPLNISHTCSQKIRGIQAVDLFCWGISRKYEQKDEGWYTLFDERLVHEQRFIV